MGSSVRGLDFGCFFVEKIFCNFLPSKRGANYPSFDPPPLDTLIPEMPFSFFWGGIGPHVSPMSTVCPRNGLTEEPTPPLGGGLKRVLIRPLDPLEQCSTRPGRCWSTSVSGRTKGWAGRSLRDCLFLLCWESLGWPPAVTR